MGLRVQRIEHANEMAVQSALLPMFQLGAVNVNLVYKLKYLGLLINNCLTWRCQMENIKGKVSRRISLLKYCKNTVSMETLKGIYRSIVEPHLNYCLSFWGCSGITRVVSLQELKNRPGQIVTGSPYDAPSVLLRKELGWLSIKEMVVKETSTMIYKGLTILHHSTLVTYLLDYQIPTNER